MYAHFLIGRERTKQRINKATANALGCTLTLAGYNGSTVIHLVDALNWQGSGDVIIETAEAVRYYARPRE